MTLPRTQLAVPTSTMQGRSSGCRVLLPNHMRLSSSRPTRPRGHACPRGRGLAPGLAELPKKRVLRRVRRDLDPCVHGEYPVRPGDDRVEVEADLRVGDVMTPDPDIGGTWMTVAGFIDQIALHSAQAGFPVISPGGSLAGATGVSRLGQIPGRHPARHHAGPGHRPGTARLPGRPRRSGHPAARPVDRSVNRWKS